MTTTKLRSMDILQTDIQRFVTLTFVTNSTMGDKNSVLDTEVRMVFTEGEAWRISEDLNELLAKPHEPEVIWVDRPVCKEFFDGVDAAKLIRAYYAKENYDIVNINIVHYLEKGVEVRFKRVHVKEPVADSVPYRFIKIYDLNI